MIVCLVFVWLFEDSACLSVLVNSFVTNSQNTITSGSSVNGQTVSGLTSPPGDPWIVVTGASLTVQSCTFTNFNFNYQQFNMFSVQNGGSISFYSCQIDGVSAQGGYLFQFEGVSQVILYNSEINNVVGQQMGIINIPSSMLSGEVVLYGIKMSDCSIMGYGQKLFAISPTYFWVGSCDFVDCTVDYVIHFGGEWPSNNRVECQGLYLKHVTSGNNIFELLSSPPGQAQVITDSYFEDTPIRFSATSVCFFTNCTFTTTDSSFTAISNIQASLSYVGCSFNNFALGVKVESGGDAIFKVCNTNFTNCASPLGILVREMSLLNCRFTGVTGTIGFMAYDSQQIVNIKSCLFEFSGSGSAGIVSSQGAAIEATILNSVFIGSRAFVSLPISGTLQLNGCCFQAAQGTVTSGLTGGTQTIGTNTYGSSSCAGQFSLSTEQGFCDSVSSFPPAPTPLRTLEAMKDVPVSLEGQLTSPTASSRSRSSTPTASSRSRSSTPTASSRSWSSTPTASSRSRSSTPAASRSPTEIPNAAESAPFRTTAGFGSSLPFIGTHLFIDSSLFGPSKSFTGSSVLTASATPTKRRSSNPTYRATSSAVFTADWKVIMKPKLIVRTLGVTFFWLNWELGNF